MIGFLIFCFVLLMVLPVLDLPLATSVPVYVWLLLLLLDIFLIGALLRRRKTGRSAGLVPVDHHEMLLQGFEDEGRSRESPRAGTADTQV